MKNGFLISIVIVSFLLSNCSGTHTEYKFQFLPGVSGSKAFGRDTCINGVTGAWAFMGVEVDDPVGIGIGIGYDHYSLNNNNDIPGYSETMYSINYELGCWYLIPNIIKVRTDTTLNPMPYFGLNLGMVSLTDSWSQDNQWGKFSGSSTKSYFSYSPYIGLRVPLTNEWALDGAITYKNISQEHTPNIQTIGGRIGVVYSPSFLQKK